MKMIKGYASGSVQGVGFRYWVQMHAIRSDITGYAKNLDDGRVEVVLCGKDEAIEGLVAAVKQGPPASMVSHFEYNECIMGSNLNGFQTY